jgi:hypothetical protein
MVATDVSAKKWQNGFFYVIPSGVEGPPLDVELAEVAGFYFVDEAADVVAVGE